MVHPTLPLRDSSDTTGDVQRILVKLEANGRNLRIARLLANSSNGFRPYVLMSDALLNRATLPANLREVAILSVAAQLGAEYEWQEHVAMSEAAGISDEQRSAISSGQYQGACFSEDERQSMQLALKLLAGRFSFNDWKDAESRWGRDAVLDLIFTVAWWGGFMHLVIQGLEDHGLRSPAPLDRPTNHDYDCPRSLPEGLGG